ncbi:MAG: hypothetical protein ABII71_03685 [Candidatus Micrarchaeota archaeon]
MPEPTEPMGEMDIARTTPDDENALFALAIAADLYESAKSRLESGDSRGSLSDSKNCIRMAASALLYKDGYMAASLETTIYYLEKNYSGMFPVQDWKIIEELQPDDVGGIYSFLVRRLGLKKKKETPFGDETEVAGTALGIAEKFVLAVRYIFEAHIENALESQGMDEAGEAPEEPPEE